MALFQGIYPDALRSGRFIRITIRIAPARITIVRQIYYHKLYLYTALALAAMAKTLMSYVIDCGAFNLSSFSLRYRQSNSTPFHQPIST